MKKNTVDKINICNKCSTQFRTKTSAKCPSCCRGEVKTYNKSDAVVINALERAGYEVLDYSIPRDTDLDREIKIEIANERGFTPFEPLEGFTCKSAKQPLDTDGNKRSVAFLDKHYRTDMPNWEYALELAQDKARLTEWVFSLPFVKDFMQYNTKRS